MPNFNLKFKEAIAYAESKDVVLPDAYYSLTMRGRATTVSGLAGISQIEFVVDQMRNALKEGKSIAQFQNDVRQGVVGLSLPSYRLDTVFRTNIQGAYNFGRFEQQQRNVATRPFLMYDAINDGRTRPSHALLDNTIARADDPFWLTHYPPLGYNCRCLVISLSQSQAEKRGITKDLPNVDADEGFAMNVAQFKQSLEKIVEDKMAELEIKYEKSSKSLAIIHKRLLNDEAAMLKVNSLLTQGSITGPVKDQYMNILKTLNAKDGTVDQLDVSLLNEYVQNGSRGIKQFLIEKSEIPANVTASEWIRASFNKLEAMALNETPIIYRGQTHTAKADIESIFIPGEVIKISTPTSFSKERNVGDSHAAVGGVLFVIENADGHGIDIVKAGATTLQAQREREVLIPPDKKFKVISSERNSIGTLIIKMSVTDEDFTKEF